MSSGRSVSLLGLGSSTRKSSSASKPSKAAVTTAVPVPMPSAKSSSPIATTSGSDEVHSASTLPVVPSSKLPYTTSGPTRSPTRISVRGENGSMPVSWRGGRGGVGGGVVGDTPSPPQEARNAKSGRRRTWRLTGFKPSVTPRRSHPFSPCGQASHPEQGTKSAMPPSPQRATTARPEYTRRPPPPAPRILSPFPQTIRLPQAPPASSSPPASRSGCAAPRPSFPTRTVPAGR